MGVYWSGSFAAPHSARGARRRVPSAGSSSRPERLLVRRLTSPAVLSRWLRVALARSQRQAFRWPRVPSARGHRSQFASSSPLVSTARGEDALTYPAQMVALGRVVASTRGVLAAQAHVAAHKAARSHAP